jgi:hypothetical protein
MKTKITAVLVASMVGGCAVAPPSTDYSLIDPQGVDMGKYRSDYGECAQLANQTSVGGRAAAGALVGAALGAILGAAICGRECAQAGARAGAAGGVVGGTGGGVEEQQRTLRNCLNGRGYTVIR